MGRSRLTYAMALIAVVFLVGGCGDENKQRGVDASTIDESQSVTPGLSPSPVESSANTPGTDNLDAVAPPPASATTPDQVAAGFATAWVRGGLTASQWWTGIKVWCEPVFAEDLRSVDPRNLPARA